VKNNDNPRPFEKNTRKSFIYCSGSSNVISPAMQNTIPLSLHIFHFISMEVRLIHVLVVPVLQCYIC
jgi:hypothetical protein